MFEHDFRVVMRMFHIPGIFVLFYFLFFNESVPWLLATGRVDRGIKAIKRIARFNRLELPESTIESIKFKYSTAVPTQQQQKAQGNIQSPSVLHSFWKMLKTRTLCLRFLNVCFQWVATYFTSLGLYQYSIQIPNVDRYVSYLIMISADIPGTILVQLLLNRIKRRTLLFSAHLLTGIVIVITSFVPKEYPWIVISCFVIAKSFLHLSTVVMNQFTTEQFPTNIRTTVLNIASTCAQIGSMLAPFIIILVRNSLTHLISIFFTLNTIWNIFICREPNGAIMFRLSFLAVRPFRQRFLYLEAQKRFEKNYQKLLLMPLNCSNLFVMKPKQSHW